MFVLSALCVLLPLAAALETCDNSKTAAFLANDKLEGNLLDNFADKKFWFVAVASENAGTSQSVEVTCGSVSSNQVPVQFVYRDSTGATTSTVDSTYTLDGDHVMTSTNSAYFFQCSTNLIVGYRCQGEGTTGGSGPKYFVWAAWDKTEAVASAELEACQAKILEMLVLSALCVLLPLVAALETCDDSKTAALLAMDQLDGNLLDYFGGKRFWNVAASTLDARTAQSIDINFDCVKDSSVHVQLFTLDSAGAVTSTTDDTYTVDGDHIKAERDFIYFFQCSPNLIGAYRCQGQGTTEGTGPIYIVWAAWEKSDDDVSAELECCLAKFTNLDASATFVLRTHP